MITTRFEECDFVEWAKIFGYLIKNNCTLCKKKKKMDTMVFLKERHANTKDSFTYYLFCNISCRNIWMLRNV